MKESTREAIFGCVVIVGVSILLFCITVLPFIIQMNSEITQDEYNDIQNMLQINRSETLRLKVEESMKDYKVILSEYWDIKDMYRQLEFNKAKQAIIKTEKE